MSPRLLSAIFGVLLVSAATGTELRVASLNVRNYLQMNRWEQGQFRFAYPKPEPEKACLRAKIAAQLPDLLFLQEMGDHRFLLELQADLRREGMDYPFARSSMGAGSDRGLAVLSRIEPDEFIHYDPVATADGGSMRRGIQELRIVVAGVAIHFLHVHIKSRYSRDRADPDASAARSAELAALLAWLQSRYRCAAPGGRWVVLGDFNTPLDAPLLEPLRQFGHALPLVDGSGADWTYMHLRSGNLERIDGVFIRAGDELGFRPVGLYPESVEDMCGSDHRMLLFVFAPQGD